MTVKLGRGLSKEEAIKSFLNGDKVFGNNSNNGVIFEFNNFTRLDVFKDEELTFHLEETPFYISEFLGENFSCHWSKDKPFEVKLCFDRITLAKAFFDKVSKL